jgi:hypothetical protein
MRGRLGGVPNLSQAARIAGTLGMSVGVRGYHCAIFHQRTMRMPNSSTQNDTALS